MAAFSAKISVAPNNLYYYHCRELHRCQHCHNPAAMQTKLYRRRDALKEKKITLPDFKLAFFYREVCSFKASEGIVFLCQVGEEKKKTLPEEKIYGYNVFESWKGFCSVKHREGGHRC